MAEDESRLSDNINTLKDCVGSMDEGCRQAFNEVMDFMKQNGPIASQLSEQGLVKIDGTSLRFSPHIYPREKSKK